MANDARKLLLVDDDEVDAYLIRKAFGLASVPLEFNHLMDGRDLNEYLNRASAPPHKPAPPDIVLLDINMPAMNGFEVLRKLREFETVGHIPVVMLTTSTLPADVERAYREGANSFIVKPNSVDEMQAFAEGFSQYWFKLARLPLAET
jgi:CheY-like chemotaxis protein